MLNYDWLLGREAVDAAEAGDASLGYSSHIWVGGWLVPGALPVAHMMMMLLPLSTGSYFAGKLAGFC